MKFEVYREMVFSSAHKLRNYCGKCENIHGHNWKVRLYIKRQTLNETGFVMDFKDVDGILKRISDILDHKDINSLPEFSLINPTTENIALFIFNKASEEVKNIDKMAEVSKVFVWESEKSCACVEG